MTPPNNNNSELVFDCTGLKSWQNAAAKAIYDCIVENRFRQTKRGLLLVAPTRTGKTFGVAKAIQQAQINDQFPPGGDDLRLCKILVFAPKSCLIQHTRVFRQLGVKDFMVISYAAGRSSIGENWIQWVKHLEYGNVAEKPIWRDEDKPDMIWLDEVQLLKNYKCQAAKVIQAAIEQGILVICSSATPFVTVDEAKITCMALGLVSDHNWVEFSKSFCGVHGPKDLSPANMRRLTDYLEEQKRIVRYENIIYAHKVFNKCVIVEFPDAATETYFRKAYEDYLEEIRHINKNAPGGLAAIWVAMLKFRMRAEECKVPILWKESERLVKEGFQVIMASNFVETLRLYWKYGKKFGFDMSKVVHLTGAVDDMARQTAVDRFQSGSADIFVTTLKAGGVGLSLHHERPTARPRRVLLPPTWSGIEMAQMLGRAHGPTSLSTTKQYIYWFARTIEQTVADRCGQRFSCLSELVSKEENWVKVFNQEVEKDGADNDVGKKLVEEQFDTDADSGKRIEVIDPNMFAIAEVES